MTRIGQSRTIDFKLMRLNRLTIVVTALMVAGLSHPLAAQSLGDLARQEQERRKAIKAPAKVITNKDLGPVPPAPESPAPPAPAPPAPPRSAQEAAKQADQDGAKDPNEPVKDQAYWSGRMKALQASLERDQTYVEALQSRINALSTDFVNRDDPVQQRAIGRDRQKAVDELNRLNAAILVNRRAIADLEEEARRAGVPPGWLR